MAIFRLKLPNDPPNVWHLCQRCVKNVPTLQLAGSRHLRMRRCEKNYFILINIAGQWQDSDYMYMNRFMKSKDVKHEDNFIHNKTWKNKTWTISLDFLSFLKLNYVMLTDCYVCFKPNRKGLICIYVFWISNGNISIRMNIICS